jgi:hypothetical protein
MPAHIYSMVGLWEDSIRSNLSALEIQPDYYHAADFAVYAYLQLAQDAKAKGFGNRSPSRRLSLKRSDVFPRPFVIRRSGITAWNP